LRSTAAVRSRRIQSADILPSIESMTTGNHDPTPEGIAPRQHESTFSTDGISQGARIAGTTAGPIEYAEKGAGIPLLSIHGAGGSYDQGLANVADLVEFRVIAPSRFGYLGTPVPPDTSSACQADAHAALLTELKVDKAIVVGISAGAHSAVQLAVRHPERMAALILIVPGTYAPASPVAIEGSRASALVLWLVNTGADFAWWATERNHVGGIVLRASASPPPGMR